MTSNKFCNIDLPSTKQILWQEMHHSLAELEPSLLSSDNLPCPICGRSLPEKYFTIEHVLPKQALANDPLEIKQKIYLNRRSRLTLLCNKPLKIGSILYKLGCNGWKGKYFDSHLKDIIDGSFSSRMQSIRSSQRRVAVSMAAYLAAISYYGYRVVYTPSGILMRRQFFHPYSFIDGVPDACQVIWAGSRFTYPEIPIESWKTPFTFNFASAKCFVTMRQIGIYIPMSQNPDILPKSGLKFIPSKYVIRPDFDSILE